MPWRPSDAKRHTKAASTPAKAKRWAEVANATLRRTGDDARAIRTANAAVRTNTDRAKRKRAIQDAMSRATRTRSR